MILIDAVVSTATATAATTPYHHHQYQCHHWLPLARPFQMKHCIDKQTLIPTLTTPQRAD